MPRQRHDDRRPAQDASFYHLADVTIGTQCCQGTACFVARRRNPMRWAEAQACDPRVYCLGRCFAGPAAAGDQSRPAVEIACDTAVILGRISRAPSPGLSDYRADAGYQGLARALSSGPEAILGEVDTSGLRGRGGAGFPTARKWRAAHAQPDGPRVLVVNADEGDPGAYIDRYLLEDDPHAVLEGMAIAALAVGAERAYIYVRREYPRALATVRAAVAEAESAGILGDALLGDGPPLTVTVVEGKGSYLCGEETALLNALEGRRPMVRARPPYPAQSGLNGVPTVVNNVETLAAVPWILRNGGTAYARLGSGTSKGTKVVSLNSLFRRPGLYEVEFGIPLREIVEGLGGGLVDGQLRGVIVGGPLAGVIPPHLLDVSFTFDDLRRIGAEVGHGGIVAFDDTTPIGELVRHVFRFGAYESCGACTPCRAGAARVEQLFSGDLDEAGHAEWQATIRALAATSLCGHGTGLAEFARSVMAYYGQDLESCRA
ncbi:NADH-ubiquinone oxidoreductase-F iron-sulfur binding region domain-containing protein [Mycolicibacterium elephantis]|uniref:complex I 51 kDa subunit family protein n=1 Tax=Mycolicibacterium elephantis TaxID=81858 RepID=UPI0007E9619F|nr:NADH-ubiquinone oxidoreductase-F iron-sulfur binding region domain-containing protein [Mycolicibacterium elephantis]OBA69816.1 NADH dehydrogenase [Mycolicibacterium elephantis]